MVFNKHTSVSSRPWLRRFFLLLIGGITLLSIPAASSAQSIGLQRDRARGILRVIKADIEKNYYDQTYHGVDLNAVFGEADE